MLDMMTIILVFLLKSMSSSSASHPAVGRPHAAEERADDARPRRRASSVLISKTQIVVDDNTGRARCRAATRTHGVDAKYKRSGPNDLYIVPLANALQSCARDATSRSASRRARIRARSEAIVIADATTPYRLLIEVLFTLGQSEFGKYHLMVLQSGGRSNPRAGSHRRRGTQAAAAARRHCAHDKNANHELEQSPHPEEAGALR